MARKYVRIGEPDEHGMRDMVVKQEIGKRGDGQTLAQEITYRAFGVEKDAPKLWLAYVANVLPTLGDDTVAEWYEDWVYGADLSARQGGKSGGPIAPLVPASKEELMDLVTGKLFTRNTEKPEEITGREPVDLARRIRYINRAVETAMDQGANVPKAIISGRDGLVAAGAAKLDAGLLVAVTPGAPAPEAPSAPAGRNRK